MTPYSPPITRRVVVVRSLYRGSAAGPVRARLEFALRHYSVWDLISIGFTAGTCLTVIFSTICQHFIKH